MSTYQYIVFLCAMFTFSSCQKEDNILVAGCCGNKPNGGTLGNSMVFIPNIFTPNGDGVNDHFFIIGDSIRMIINFEVRNENGNSVYQIKNIPANDYASAWDGKFHGVVQKGLYRFSADIEAKNGAIGNFEGWVCNYPCGEIEGDEIRSFTDCVFPSDWFCWQYDDGCHNYDFPPCF